MVKTLQTYDVYELIEKNKKAYEQAHARYVKEVVPTLEKSLIEQSNQVMKEFMAIFNCDLHWVKYSDVFNGLFNYTYGEIYVKNNEEVYPCDIYGDELHSFLVEKIVDLEQWLSNNFHMSSDCLMDIIVDVINHKENYKGKNLVDVLNDALDLTTRSVVDEIDYIRTDAIEFQLYCEGNEIRFDSDGNIVKI